MRKSFVRTLLGKYVNAIIVTYDRIKNYPTWMLKQIDEDFICKMSQKISQKITNFTHFTEQSQEGSIFGEVMEVIITTCCPAISETSNSPVTRMFCLISSARHFLALASR